MYRPIFILLLILIPVAGSAQIKTIGTPHIYNYSKSDYNAGTQNWGISQDQNGFMYFANNDGVLVFDGLNWQLIPVALSSSVRSICIDKNNSVYIGLFNDFGRLITDASGKVRYESLRPLIPDNIGDFNDIWKIYDTSYGIVFQTYEYLFILKDGKMKVIRPQKKFHFTFYVNGRLFLHEPGEGLFELINGLINKVPWADALNDCEIWTILDLRENYLLIGTARDGIYKFENGKLEKWDTPVNRLIEQNKLYSATKIADNNYVFGTILSGIIISDNKGNIIQHINKDKGLQNNTVLSVCTDKGNNLWLGLDNGIDYVEINSPITFISGFEGLGTGYCCRIFDGKIYLGTNQGLYVKPFDNFSYNDADFELVKNSVGQVWSLTEMDGQLICGHNFGTFIIENQLAKKISDEAGAWKYIPLKNHPGYLLGGHYNGLVLLKESNQGWNFDRKIKGFNESSRFLFEDKDGLIWISHGTKGIFKVTLSENMDSVIHFRLYTKEDGLPSTENNNLFEYKGKEYVSTTNGIYSYDAETDTFFKDPEMMERFHISGRIKTFETDDSESIWFIAEHESGVLRLNEDMTFTKITAPLKQLDGEYVNEFEFIYPYSNEHVFIGLDNGFAHYSTKFPKSYLKLFPSFITKVELPYIDSTLTLKSIDSSLDFHFPFKKNAFRFYYTAPFYENLEQLKFSYFLENYSDDWSPWTKDRYKDFTNLPEGKYNFKLKAQNIYGVESDVSTFKFSILPPWHRSTIAYYIYFLLTGVVVFLSVKYILYRLELSKKKEEQKHKLELQKKEEQFQHQTLVSEKEIIRLRNEKLKNEMLHRDKELANQTMSIIQKNKFLTKLKDELLSIQKSTPDAQLKTKFSVISKRINKEIDNKQQNQIFETYFDEVHEEFFERLKQQFPQLSPREMRLCAYIRMNLSSKEIAALLNIGDRGVEIGRYRLRKKLELPRETSLSTYLSHI